MTTLPTFTTLGAGPTILMLHDIGGGHRAFAPQVESFAAAGYRAVAWDMPGYGHSAPIDPYTFKGLAQSCGVLIDSLMQSRGGGGVILLGHGMGGMVAQEVAARRPELVRRLVLCATSAQVGPAEADARLDWQRDYVAASLAPLEDGQDMTALAQTVVPQLIGPAALPEGVALAKHVMAQLSPATYRRALEALVGFDRQASLDRIHVPTLLLGGAADTVSPPAVMRQMAQAIGGSSYLELPGIGHLPQLEAPDDFDGLVLNFLAMPSLLN
ncbi:alpha/beta hydrolase [Rhodoferax koreense]|uniref:Alpha/beta hydrolase n=1 Tax=Rhodoferax koreensis TaxID=1842727 RepID=A0A1P8JQ87_9BURK|nr:alpha/beta fold hydrolase [Rhodoferax koreense]APW35895.1 alpha/beta hydrolase [Rhodoferax koreense]